MVSLGGIALLLLILLGVVARLVGVGRELDRLRSDVNLESVNRIEHIVPMLNEVRDKVYFLENPEKRQGGER